MRKPTVSTPPSSAKLEHPQARVIGEAMTLGVKQGALEFKLRAIMGPYMPDHLLTLPAAEARKILRDVLL